MELILVWAETFQGYFDLKRKVLSLEGSLICGNTEGHSIAVICTEEDYPVSDLGVLCVTA